jgi:sugar phosphate permease
MNRTQKPLTLASLQIIATALMASLGIYGYALDMKLSQSTDAVMENPFMLPAMGTMAILCFGAGIFIPQMLIKAQRVEMVKKYGNNLSALSVDEIVLNIGAALVVRLALFEAIALFGFGLSTMNHKMEYYLAFGVVSLAAMLFNFPREEKLREFLRE